LSTWEASSVVVDRDRVGFVRVNNQKLDRGSPKKFPPKISRWE
jgi:hypothetical protein